MQPPIVLIHGAFTGGWLWRRTARALEKLGFECFTPTLTGCGERSHLLKPGISLAMHVEDVAQALFCEDLERVVLAGHGYGGMIAAAVAHRHGGKVAGVIHLDSIVPERGLSYLEATGRSGFRTGSDWLAPAPPAESFGLTCREMARWLAVRLQPFPLACLESPYPYGRRDRAMPGAYLRTSQAALDPAVRAQSARAALNKARVVDLDTGPLPMVSNPGRLAKAMAACIEAMEVPPGETGRVRNSRRRRCIKGQEP